MYIPHKKKPALSLDKKKLSAEKAKVLSVGKELKSPIKDEIKKQDKQRKQKQKLANKMLSGMYSMMDLSKAQFL